MTDNILDRNVNNAPLESWKEIAVYLQRDVKTVQRWEKKEGLPVHRQLHKSRSSVYAFPSEVDAWRAHREPEPAEPPVWRRFPWRAHPRLCFHHCFGGGATDSRQRTANTGGGSSGGRDRRPAGLDRARDQLGVQPWRFPRRPPRWLYYERRKHLRRTRCAGSDHR